MTINVTSVDKLDPLRKLSLMDLSYSRIDTYTMCPAKYFYSYITKEPRFFNEAATLGNIVHAVLEDNVQSTEHVDYEKLLYSYNEKKSHYDPESIIDPQLIDVGKVILEEFYDRHSEEDFKVVSKEMSFSYVLGSFYVNGYIDRIDEFDSRVEIIDYKTGKWEVAAKNIKDNLQLRNLCSSSFFGFSSEKKYTQSFII